MKGKFYSELELYHILCDSIHKYESQTEMAKTLGISKSYLNDILLGKRKISESVAAKIGFRKVTVFVKDEKK